MLRGVTVSLALIAALIVASERSVSATCILLNAPGHKTCAPACCPNKSCCEKSQKRTGEPAQPLATTSSHQQSLVALTAVISGEHVDQLRAIESPCFFNADQFRHSSQM